MEYQYKNTNNNVNKKQINSSNDSTNSQHIQNKTKMKNLNLKLEMNQNNYMAYMTNGLKNFKLFDSSHKKIINQKSKILNINLNKLIPSGTTLNRNRNVSSQKYSEKETNLKTETSLFDKKDCKVNLGTPKLNCKFLDENKSLEEDETNLAISSNFVCHTQPTCHHYTLEKDFNANININDDKDKLIKKLHNKIFDLENKLKNIEEFLFNNDKLNTEGNDEDIYLITNPDKSHNKMMKSMNFHKNDKNLNQNIPKQKSLSKSLTRGKFINSGNINNKFNFNQNLFITSEMNILKERLYNFNTNSNKFLTNASSPKNKNVNFDLFKPLQIKNKSLFQTFNNKTSVEDSVIKNPLIMNKTQVKNSFDSRGKSLNKSKGKFTIKSTNKSLNKSLNKSNETSPKNKYSRKDFLMKEINKNEINSSLIIETEKKENYKIQFDLIKNRTKNLLSKLTKNNKILLNKIHI